MFPVLWNLDVLQTCMFVTHKKLKISVVLKNNFFCYFRNFISYNSEVFGVESYKDQTFFWSQTCMFFWTCKFTRTENLGSVTYINETLGHGAAAVVSNRLYGAKNPLWARWEHYRPFRNKSKTQTVAQGEISFTSTDVIFKMYSQQIKGTM